MAAKDPVLRRLGSYLRNVREEHGWSQEDLAFECGLHRTYVGAVERGEYNLTVLSLQRIADALGISLVDAMKGATRRARP
ncbi:MAG: helix-turn-helix transcriptional regulator [Phycisphaerales bacterium]|nr:helix-turn-helix transcriptional regulator [Phycisphaerales bacterium]